MEQTSVVPNPADSGFTVVFFLLTEYWYRFAGLIVSILTIHHSHNNILNIVLLMRQINYDHFGACERKYSFCHIPHKNTNASPVIYIPVISSQHLLSCPQMPQTTSPWSCIYCEAHRMRMSSSAMEKHKQICKGPFH